jgi:RNA polymerase sigma factor (sigma-70 family)
MSCLIHAWRGLKGDGVQTWDRRTRRFPSGGEMLAPVESQSVDVSRLEGLADGELVLLLKQGYEEALGVLLRRHSDALYRFCCHLMPNREDAEDICQESMAKAIARADSLHTGAAFRSWLFSIARNLSIDTHRARKRLTPLPDEEDGSPIMLYHDDAQERLEIGEEHQTVAEALNKLARSH